MQDTSSRDDPDGGTSRFDWTQWFCPGPRRVFSADEMARAGGQPWPKVVDGYVYGNAAVLLAINYNQFDRHLAYAVSGLVMTLVWAALAVAPALNLAAGAATVPLVGLALIARFVFHLDRSRLEVPMLITVAVFVGAVTAWWFLTLYRVQQIEGRLRELDDQEAALRLRPPPATPHIHP